MQRPSISIIVPVYNTDKYLCKCLDSILAQTYTNWEAILVDDGSTDKSGKICDEYAAKDKRFNVIHQNNGGVSVARQTGLDNSTGDYIIHCDPDDWIEPTMLEDMLKCALANNADMVICDIVSHQYGKNECHKQNIANNITAKELQTKIINEEIHGSCCNKLVKKNVCKGIAFYPTSITYCEDELFNLRLLCQDIKITYLPKGLYHYIQRTGSNSTPGPGRIYSKIQFIEEVKSFIDDYNFHLAKKDILIAAFLSKNYKLLKNLYPETQAKMLDSGIKYNIKFPLSSCLLIAIKGYPHLASFIYTINMLLIICIKKIRRK